MKFNLPIVGFLVVFLGLILILPADTPPPKPKKGKPGLSRFKKPGLPIVPEPRSQFLLVKPTPR